MTASTQQRTKVARASDSFEANAKTQNESQNNHKSVRQFKNEHKLQSDEKHSKIEP